MSSRCAAFRPDTAALGAVVVCWQQPGPHTVCDGYTLKCTCAFSFNCLQLNCLQLTIASKPNHSMQVVNPGRDLPLGILGALGVVTVSYMLMSAALVMMVPVDKIELGAPFAAAFRCVAGLRLVVLLLQETAHGRTSFPACVGFFAVVCWKYSGTILVLNLAHASLVYSSLHCVSVLCVRVLLSFCCSCGRMFLPAAMLAWTGRVTSWHLAL